MADEMTIPYLEDFRESPAERAFAAILKDFVRHVKVAAHGSSIALDVLRPGSLNVLIDVDDEWHSEPDASVGLTIQEYEQFVHAHWDKLVNRVRRYVGRDHADHAEDLVQATLWAVWQHWPEIRSPYAYAVKVANRLVVRYLNADARLRADPLAENLPSQPSGQEADAVALRIDFMRAIRGLSKRQGEVLRLRMGGKTHQEIAALLGIQPVSVRVHLHAARKTLHARLGERMGAPDDQ